MNGLIFKQFTGAYRNLIKRNSNRIRVDSEGLLDSALEEEEEEDENHNYDNDDAKETEDKTDVLNPEYYLIHTGLK